MASVTLDRHLNSFGPPIIMANCVSKVDLSAAQPLPLNDSSAIDCMQAYIVNAITYQDSTRLAFVPCLGPIGSLLGALHSGCVKT